MSLPQLATVFAEHKKSALWVAVATLAVEVGGYIVFRAMGAGAQSAAMAAMLMSLVWIAMAAPAASAGAATVLGGVLRAGVIADTSAVLLAVVWFTVAEVGLIALLEVYVTFAAVVLLAAAGAQAGRTVRGRTVLASLTSILLMALLSSPAWCGGLLLSTEGQMRRQLATALVWANPFYSVTSAMADSIGFVWQQAPVMYRLSFLHDFVAVGPVPWWASATLYGGLASALGVTCMAARRILSSR